MKIIKAFINKITSLLKSSKSSNFLFACVSIAAGLLIGFIIMIFTNPANSFNGLVAILAGPLQGGIKGIGQWLYYAAPIMLTGLSVGFAFKTGLFNIGASGQYTMGLFAALVCGLTLSSLGSVHWIVCILAGILAGAFWGFIPGFFKAYFNVNEVITSIMFNYIGLYIVNMIITGNPVLYNVSKGQAYAVLPSAFNPELGLDVLFGRSGLDCGIIIAVVMAIVVNIVLNKTTFGYELKACGFNRNAAKYGGINEKRSIILSMTISGALAGLAGAIFILSSGAFNSGMNYEPVDEILATGFNGISVALLGMSNPIGIIFSSLFITYIQRGGYYMQSYDFKTELIDIIISVILYFSAFVLIFKTYFEQRREKRKIRNDQIQKTEFLAAETSSIDTATTEDTNQERGDK